MIPIDFTDIENCPVRGIVASIGDKWSLLILLHLTQQDMRFSALRRIIPDISQRVLTATLRKLQRDGLVWREVKPTVPPQVTYGLTPLSRSLTPILKDLAHWAQQNRPQIATARRVFDMAVD